MARRSAGWRWLLAASVLAAAAVAVLRVTASHDDADALFAALPSSTGNVVVAQRLDALLGAVGKLDAQPATPVELHQFASDLRTQSRALLGFDATRLAAWKKAGFDPAGAWALAASGKHDDPFTYAYLPVSDAAAARSSLSTALARLGARVEERGEITRVVWQERGAAAMRPRALGVRGGFLAVAFSTEPADATTALSKQLAGSGLSKSDSLRRLRETLGGSWSLFGYTAPQLVRTELKAQGADEALGPLLEGGLAGALQLSDEKVSLRVRALGDGQRLVQTPFAAPHPPTDHSGPSTPLLAVRASVNVQALLARLERDPNGARSVEAARAAVAALGLDLKRDVLEPLDGQLAIGFLPPESGARGLFDVVATAGVKDPKQSLARWAPAFSRAGLAQQPDGWFADPATALGPSGDALVLVGAPPSRRAAIEAAVSRGEKPFWSSLPADAREAFEHGPALYAYADLERVAERLANVKLPGGQGSKRVLRALQAASAGLDLRDGMLVLDADLYPPPGGFAQALSGSKAEARR